MTIPSPETQLTVADVRDLLLTQIATAGTKMKAAMKLQIDPAQISRFLRDDRQVPSPTLIKALGLEAKTVYLFRAKRVKK